MGAQLALFLEAAAAPAPATLTLVAPLATAPTEPLSLTAKIKAWLIGCSNTDTTPVRFYHLCDAFPDETASDLDIAARPFEIGHDSGANTYEAN